MKQKTDEPIIVEVGEPSSAEDRKKPLNFRREIRYFRRKSTTGVLQFFDMGRKWNGSTFVDVNYHQLPVLNILGPTYGYAHGTATVWDGWHKWGPLASTYTALQNNIIDYDLADIETMHPRLKTTDDGYWFNITLVDPDSVELRNSSDDVTNWKVDGWHVPQEELDSIEYLGTHPSYNANLFHNLYFSGGIHTRHHFTATFDHTAPDLPDFRLELGDKIFWMPIMNQNGGIADYDRHATDTISTGTFHYTDYLTSDFMVIPRTPFLDPYNENYLDGTNDDNPGDPDAMDLKRARFLQTYGYGKRVARVHHNVVYNWEDDYGDPNAWPPPDYNNNTSFGMHVGWIGDSNFESKKSFGGAVPAGTLLAIIKRGTSLFFVWMI